MNIRVDLNTTIKDGMEVVFRSPVDCSQITGLIVYYREDGKTSSKEFALADAHGNNVGDIDHLFAENVVVKVILDVTHAMAFVQNADTNAYIEKTFIKTVNGVAPDENGNVEIVVEGGSGKSAYEYAVEAGYEGTEEDFAKMMADLCATLEPQSANLFDKSNIEEGKYLGSNLGGLHSDDDFFASDFIYVGNFETIKVSYTHIVCWYDENKAFVSTPETMNSGSEDLTLSVPSGVKYLRFSAYNQNLDKAQVGLDVSRDNYVPYVVYGYVKRDEYKKDIAAIEAKIANLEESAVQNNTGNRFDKSNILEGKYLGSNQGGLLSNDDFFASDFIYVGDCEKIKVSYTHIVCWYDENKAFVSTPETMNSGSEDLTLTVPSGVKYLRFSAYLTNLDKAQVGIDISRDNYVPYGGNAESDSDDIVVAADGTGNYSSFTLACKENYTNNKNIIVKAGTYDIAAEYVAIWGQEAVDNMADADKDVFDGWQYGVKLNNRKFTFMPGAKLVCDWTGHTVDGTHRFSALRVEMNVEIICLDLEGTSLFYVIHDDYGNNETYYTNIYRNCQVIGHNIRNANCIGGGCKKHSRHIIDNCYFDNGGTASSTTVRYHNTNADGATPELFVSNSYFNGCLTPRYYGSQTSKMRAYVNNCKAQRIYVTAESSSHTTENVDLFKWGNVELEEQSTENWIFELADGTTVTKQVVVK